MKSWLHLEQATIWCRKAVQECDSNGRPCEHCVKEAISHLQASLEINDATH